MADTGHAIGDAHRRGDAADARGGVVIGRAPIDPLRLLDALGDAATGAHVLFVGTVRGTTGDVVTARLEYDAHEPLAAALLGRLRAEAVRRYGLTACAVEHRLGALPPGAASVAVAAGAPHRREAFAAAEWLMERIKREVPIWKCECRPDGTRAWVHPDPPAGGQA